MAKQWEEMRNPFLKQLTGKALCCFKLLRLQFAVAGVCKQLVNWKQQQFLAAGLGSGLLKNSSILSLTEAALYKSS